MNIIGGRQAFPPIYMDKYFDPNEFSLSCVTGLLISLNVPLIHIYF